MILLKKIIINSFLSHEKTEIDFKKDEKVLLDGASGSGKSTIFDAIIWALYGQGRSDNRALVRKGSKKGSVYLELTRIHEGTSEEDTVIITRSIATSGSHTLLITFQNADGTRVAHTITGLRPLQEWIDKELVGASWLLFVNSVAYVQGNSDSFVSQTAPKRKELLLEIIKAEDYNEYYKKARVKLSKLQMEQSNVDGQIDSLDGILSSLSGYIQGREDNIKVITDSTAKVVVLTEILKKLEVEKQTLYSLMNSVVFIKKNLEVAKGNRDFAKNMLYERNVDIKEKPKLLKVLTKFKDFDKKIDKAKKDIAEAKTKFQGLVDIELERTTLVAKKPLIVDRTEEVNRYKKNIEKIEAEPICPSGEKCPYSGDYIKQITDLKTEIKELNDITAAEASLSVTWEEDMKKLPPKSGMEDFVIEMKNKDESLKMLEADKLKIQSIKKDLSDIEGIEKKIPEIKKTLKEKEAYLKELEIQWKAAEAAADPKGLLKVDSELSKVHLDLKAENDSIAKSTANLESIAKDEEASKEYTTKIKEFKKDLIDIENKIEKVSLCKSAFNSKGGIETLTLDYLIPKLEDNVNDILSKLSEFRIHFDTQRKGSDGESIIEGLFITIINEKNEEMAFENYSGGEKLKISVAISEALATLQKVGFRLFDETFIGLDENSTESFAEVLESLQKNFGQMLCISHLTQIKELFDKKINVIKNNNISHVK